MIVRYTHGRCRSCGVVWRWPARTIRVADAHCESCGRQLDRTAAALVTSAPILDGHPLYAGAAAELRRAKP